MVRRMVRGLEQQGTVVLRSEKNGSEVSWGELVAVLWRGISFGGGIFAGGFDL